MPALAKISSPHGTPPRLTADSVQHVTTLGRATPLPIHLKHLRRHQDILPQHLLAGTRSSLISCLPRYPTSPATILSTLSFLFPDTQAIGVQPTARSSPLLSQRTHAAVSLVRGRAIYAKIPGVRASNEKSRPSPHPRSSKGKARRALNGREARQKER
jgi:hypothetical protein